MTRLVATGFDADGKSTVVRDVELKGRPGDGLFNVWAYNDGPVHIPGGIGDGLDFDTHFPKSTGMRVYTARMNGVPRAAGGSGFADLAESMQRGHIEHRDTGFHVSDTIDVAIVLRGEMGLELEDGSITTLRQGDIAIQNGTNHAWHPGEDCEMCWVLIGALRDDSKA